MGDSPLIKNTRDRNSPSACQKSLAEFAARRRQRDFDHFLSGRTPGWSLLPLRGNSPPVPDRKYLSGCKSGAAALCRAQPPKAALGAELCDLYAKGVQIVRVADCNPFVKKGQSPFLTVSGTGTVLIVSVYLSSGRFPRQCVLLRGMTGNRGLGNDAFRGIPKSLFFN